MTYTEPLVLIILIAGLFGLYRLRRREKARGLALPLAAFAALFAVAWTPLAWLLAQPFEMWYPQRATPEGEAEAIVVLSSGTYKPEPERPYSVPDTETYLRTLHAAWLHNHWRRVPVLASGGSDRGEPFAVTMARVLAVEGVPAEAVWTETRSTSTFENAVFSAALLKSRGISRVALVTNALHMPRAERAFRKQGLTVTPAPCCFTRVGPKVRNFVPAWRGIQQNEETLHEAVGLLWYWMRGRI